MIMLFCNKKIDVRRGELKVRISSLIHTITIQRGFEHDRQESQTEMVDPLYAKFFNLENL